MRRIGKKHKKKKAVFGGDQLSLEENKVIFEKNMKEWFENRKRENFLSDPICQRKNNEVNTAVEEVFDKEPLSMQCFTKDFAIMMQLFRSMTRDLNFSKPFRMVIEYDPEQLRVKRDVFVPATVLEQYTQKVMEKVKD